jgi:hypothetical protein
MRDDTSYATDIMQFNSVLPFESTIGGEHPGRSVPSMLATEAQLDVIFSGSDPGSVGLDAAKVLSVGGARGDWTHTGTSISNLTDASDNKIRDVLGSEVQFRPFPKSAGLSGQKAADIMTQYTGGGPEPVMEQPDGFHIDDAHPFLTSFFDFGDPNVTVRSTASEGDVRYDATTPLRFQRVPRSDDTIQGLSVIRSAQSTGMQRELDDLRAQRMVSGSPQLSSTKRPSEPRSSQAKNNPRRLQIKKNEDPRAKRGLNMNARVSSRGTKAQAPKRLLETME